MTGAADWWYVGSYTFTQDSNSTWNDSFSSGNSNSHSERTESADANGHGSYDFTAVSVLAANGSVTTTETLTGGGESHGHYHLTGSGYADSTSDTSDGDFSSHTELHSTFTQTDNENFDSSWQADLTIVITSSGTVVTGSVSGSDDADGAATFIAHGNGVSDSSTSGSEFSSGSHNDWTSDTTASDGYDYHGAWSDVYANGTLTSSSSVTNHIWGSLTTGSTSNWSTSSTTLDADGNPVTVTTSGGDSHGTSMSYDDTFSTGGFATMEFSKSQPGSYAGAKPGGNAAMSEPWLSSDSGRPTGDESFFGSGRPGKSGGSSGGIVLCSGPGQIVGGAGGLVVGQVPAGQPALPPSQRLGQPPLWVQMPRCAACHNPVIMGGGSFDMLPASYRLAAMRWSMTSPDNLNGIFRIGGQIAGGVLVMIVSGAATAGGNPAGALGFMAGFSMIRDALADAQNRVRPRMFEQFFEMQGMAPQDAAALREAAAILGGMGGGGGNAGGGVRDFLRNRRDYWQRSAGAMTQEEAAAIARAEGFGFEIGRRGGSRFENARNSVVIGRDSLRDGLVNRLELAEEIQHGLDRVTRQGSRARLRGLTNEQFHAEVFERILAGNQAGGYGFLTAEDIAQIRQMIVELRR
jgi:hypothetical protein